MPNKIEILESVFAYEIDNDNYDETDKASTPTLINHNYYELGFYDFLMSYNIH